MVTRKTINIKKSEPRYETRQCVDCPNTFTVRITRGRPQFRCEDCRNSRSHHVDRSPQVAGDSPYVAKSISPEARVDYLEYLLRSRGTHISQHCKDD